MISRRPWCPPGRLEPQGAIAGMAFATATRASYGARLKWPQSLDWRKVSRMFRALTPSSKSEKSLLTGRVGFDALAREEVFEPLHALIPARPGDKSRV